MSVADFRPCTISGCSGNARHKQARKGWCLKHYRRWQRHGDPLGGRNTMEGQPLAWLLSHQAHTGEDCLHWPFARNARGYGQVRHEGPQVPAHRLMCTFVNGWPPTQSHHAAHSCGKGHLGCVNPRHLRWATPSENQADRIKHGTNLSGENCPTAKLSEDQARTILALKGKFTQLKIAEMCGASVSTVGQIHTRRTWARLTQNEAAR
jgi:hypothetical protein